MIIGYKSVRCATAAKQPTMIIMAKVTVRTRTIVLKAHLGGTDGVGKSIDVEDGSLNFSVNSLLFEFRMRRTTTTSSSSSNNIINLAMIVSKVAKW